MRVLFFRGLMIAMLALTVSNGVAFAGPREDAQAAYNRGDYADCPPVDDAACCARKCSRADTRSRICCSKSGQGVPKNYNEAVKWYRLAAAQGDAPRRTISDAMYENGGVFRRTTTKRSSGIGSRLRKAMPPRKTISEDVRKRTGCSKGRRRSDQVVSARSCTRRCTRADNLGLMYENGRGVPKD